MSDSSYSTAFGLSDIFSFDEGGWAHERLPIDELVVTGFSVGARAEEASDLLSPQDRDRADFTWSENGILTSLREAEAVAAAAAGTSVAAVAAAVAAEAAAAAAAASSGAGTTG